MRAAGCAAAAIAVLCAPAFAVEVDVSLHYWASEGKTTWNHNAQPVAPTLGNPTSRLTYSGMKSDVFELGVALREREGFFRASLGVGDIRGGNLQDEDFQRGQVKFSDTNSAIKGDSLRYWIVDIGRDLASGRQGAAGVLIGFGEYRETVDAFGATNNLNGGAVLVPQSTRVITNDATWTFLRAGFNGRVSVGEHLTLLAEVAYLPVLKLDNADSHYLRSDLGPVPNVRMSGSGDGWMWQLEARVAVSKALSLSAGYRDWRFQADGTIRFGASGTSLPLNSFETTRSGARFGAIYRF